MADYCESAPRCLHGGQRAAGVDAEAGHERTATEPAACTQLPVCRVLRVVLAVNGAGVLAAALLPHRAHSRHEALFQFDMHRLSALAILVLPTAVASSLLTMWLLVRWTGMPAAGARGPSSTASYTNDGAPPCCQCALAAKERPPLVVCGAAGKRSACGNDGPCV